MWFTWEMHRWGGGRPLQRPGPIRSPSLEVSTFAGAGNMDRVGSAWPLLGSKEEGILLVRC